MASANLNCLSSYLIERVCRRVCTYRGTAWRLGSLGCFGRIQISLVFHNNIFDNSRTLPDFNSLSKSPQISNTQSFMIPHNLRTYLRITLYCNVKPKAQQTLQTENRIARRRVPPRPAAVTQRRQTGQSAVRPADPTPEKDLHQLTGAATAGQIGRDQRAEGRGGTAPPGKAKKRGESAQPNRTLQADRGQCEEAGAAEDAGLAGCPQGNNRSYCS